MFFIRHTLPTPKTIRKSRTTEKHIGVGASKILGVQRIFAQIFPNLPKQLSCNFCQPFSWCDLQKNGPLGFLQTLGAIFRSLTMLGGIFAQIFRDFA